jgi:DNA-directed RNA polymerase subunit RPC12/RpoP
LRIAVIPIGSDPAQPADEGSPTMCRYSWHHYRDHFACFRCRKAFKHWQWEEGEDRARAGKAKLHHAPREIRCPDCDAPMVDMGLDFKAPRRHDPEAWEIMEALYENGFTFHGCGCSVYIPSPPRSLRELPEWLEMHRKSSEGEALLKRFASRGG